MAAAGLLALLDDITTLLDDVATMTKVASQKTAAVIGDDLALNAKQLTGITASRELPVVRAVAVGSLVNKAILIPVALLITAHAPNLVVPLLMIGGAFLCYEGVEKLFHKFFPHAEETTLKEEQIKDLAELERQRIKGAVLTDFILSAEILVIALGAAAGKSFFVQALTLIAIGIGMTIIVYGMVALIVKADDVGFRLLQSDRKFRRSVGRFIIWAAPRFMRLLSVLGTAAMFLVGGEILAHGIHAIEHAIEQFARWTADLLCFAPGVGKFLAKCLSIIIFGIFSGTVIVTLKKATLKVLHIVRH